VPEKYSLLIDPKLDSEEFSALLTIEIQRKEKPDTKANFDWLILQAKNLEICEQNFLIFLTDSLYDKFLDVYSCENLKICFLMLF